MNFSTATSDHDKVNLFNTYFHSVFTTDSSDMPSKVEPSLPLPTLSAICISEYDVYTTLRPLDPSKSMGIDRIGPKLLNYCALALYSPLHHLFLLSLNNGKIPQEWKIHLITPIHKSGDKSKVKNYRLISLLCSVSKVLEKIVFDNIIISVTELITPNQFGFHQHHSTLHQLLKVIQNILESFSNNTQTDIIYLDYKKAFDSVAHTELLSKLWSYGIQGKLWKWFQAYLSGRMQCVQLNNVTSELLPVISGVPQGSILGPLLFLIFVNNIYDSVISSNIALFDDDPKLYKNISCSLDSFSLQQDLNRLCVWSHVWKLKLNEYKCTLVRFSSKLSALVLHNYHIIDETISEQASFKDLGIIFSSDLSWRSHHQYILANVYKMLGLLKHVFSNSHFPPIKRKLYVCLVRSKLMFDSPVWRPHLKDISVIGQLQCRATKYILREYTSTYKARLINLQLLPL